MLPHRGGGTYYNREDIDREEDTQGRVGMKKRFPSSVRMKGIRVEL